MTIYGNVRTVHMTCDQEGVEKECDIVLKNS